MPYEIRKTPSGRYCVYKEGRSEPLHCYDKKADAVQYLQALYVHSRDADKKDQASASGEVLISFGGAVKALGQGKVGGYLVTFGDESQPDTSPYRDFFAAETDYGIDTWPAKSHVYYHHGLDARVGKRRLGTGTMKADDVGVWVEAQLALRDEWEQAVYGLAEAGKLSWSSGTANHLVEREPVTSAKGDVIAHRILAWPLGLDASLTPTPAEPRCAAVALKSWAAEGPRLQLMGEESVRGASLAERTEQWLETGTLLIGGYDEVLGKELKIGRALSAARRQRIRQMWEMLGEMLDETEPREAADTDEAPGMGRPAESPSLLAPAEANALEGLFLETQARLSGMPG